MNKKSTRRARVNGAPESGALEIAPRKVDETWVRVPVAGQRLRGLERTFIYKLIAAGLVRSSGVTQPGVRRGVRLVHLPSLDFYLAAMEFLGLLDVAGEELETGAFMGAESIEEVLETHPATCDAATALLAHPRGISGYLALLARSHPERVERTPTRQSALWKISRAAK